MNPLQRAQRAALIVLGTVLFCAIACGVLLCAALVAIGWVQ